MRALRALERLAGVPADSLVQLLGPRRPRGRWLGHVPGVLRYDALFDDHETLSGIVGGVHDADDQRYRWLSVEEKITVDHARTVRSVEVRRLIAATSDGVDGCEVFYHAEDGLLPHVTARGGSRIGRTRRDFEAGVTAAELMFDHRLERGEVFLVEYEHRFDPCDEPGVGYYYCAFREPCRQYVLRAEFSQAVTPVRAYAFHANRVGAPFTDDHPLPCQRGRTMHLYASDIDPGIVGVRWEWA